MIKKTSLIILTVFLYSKGSSQFIITQQRNTPDYFHTLLPQMQTDSYNVLVYCDNGNFSTSRPPNKLLTFNGNGFITDSTVSLKGFSPVKFPVKINNFYYWASAYLDTLTSNHSSQDIYMLKFDTSFKYVSTSKISSSLNFQYVSNSVSINNKLFLAVENISLNQTKIYKLDTLFNKLDSLIYNNVKVWEINKSFSNKIIISGIGFSNVTNFGSGQKIEIDTSFTSVVVTPFDSLAYVSAGCSGIVPLRPFGFKVLPITRSKFMITGNASIVYNINCNSKAGIVNSVISANNKVLHTTIIIDSLNGVSYLDNTNFVDVKNNYIYSVGSIGQDLANGGLLQPQNTSILVCKSDTMANIIWKKSYGGDMYYRPVSIIQTLDSGLLVSGIRYNDTQTNYPGVGESFILKLDKNGDIMSVGIKENGSGNFTAVKCYPNPTRDLVYIDIPFELRYEVYVYDVVGKQVFENKFYDNKTAISTSSLNSGVYFVKIKTKANWQSYKFIKE